MLHGRDVEAGVQPRVSTGRSIHAALNIARVGEGAIDDGPSLRLRTRPKSVVSDRRQPQDDIAVALAGASHRAKSVRHRVLDPD
jgi:hypothetical protein